MYLHVKQKVLLLTVRLPCSATWIHAQNHEQYIVSKSWQTKR